MHYFSVHFLSFIKLIFFLSRTEKKINSSFLLLRCSLHPHTHTHTKREQKVREQRVNLCVLSTFSLLFLSLCHSLTKTKRNVAWNSEFFIFLFFFFKFIFLFLLTFILPKSHFPTLSFPSSNKEKLILVNCTPWLNHPMQPGRQHYKPTRRTKQLLWKMDVGS
ncbi:conserved hypothetical protein [Lodderomyces elongisporus NRRL YB-4239]|uniref:Uncharacterized protein n=1 Tax=Lodderomyces elongisporus (strain ATCC 11503 / CBS 2605 / JCM 1781 / NBRC 1676 / NRRL YB-4239) TaxID=379508 RepID=A5E6F5_LODEL|nr:conserved hypothetical protein [Lodderomyces elongisporus NRRL YB-4239]